MAAATFTTRPFSAARQFFVDGLDFGERRHCMHGLIEVDVTGPRGRIAEIKARGEEPPSFTGFVVYCAARAVAADRAAQACRDWRGRLIVFDDVDVLVPVERVRGQHFTQAVIREAERKSLAEIHEEIRAVQFGAAGGGESGFIRRFTRLPRPLRHAFFAAVVAQPARFKQVAGTMMVTSVGMFGRGAGWGVAPVGHSLTVTVGGIVPRPCVAGGQLVEREHLCLTVTFDHAVIDGGPAARFVVLLKDLLEAGAGLAEA